MLGFLKKAYAGIMEDNMPDFRSPDGSYKKELENYGNWLRDEYRATVKKLSREDQAKLGWSVSMAHDGLTKVYSGLPTVRRYMDTWHSSNDMNKAFFELDPALKEKSHQFHQKIIHALYDGEKVPEYDVCGTGDFVNTIDYQVVTQITKDTRKEKIERILDFGAGYGRQANLYSQHPDCKEYTIVEAIEDSYVVQSIYMKIAAEKILDNCTFNEALLGRMDFKSNTKKLNHLMTFDMDKIPNEHYDLIICSNVLNEIMPDVFEYVIKQMARILKKGGILYVKDHGLGDQCGHRYYDYDVLESLNFALEYRPFVTDFKDIWTVPRIYRKYGDEKPSFLKPAKHIEPFPG